MASLEDYFGRSFEQGAQIPVPDSSDAHLTPATRLLEKRHEMQEIETALTIQKDEFQQKMESLAQRRQELHRKEYQLKHSLLRFDKFLKENDSKRARAEDKTSNERLIKEEKIQEIKRLRAEHENLKLEKETQKNTLEKTKIFQSFLDKALDLTEEFSEIYEFIARYDTLTQTNRDLVLRQQQNLEEIEVHKGLLVKFTEDKQHEILRYNNVMASLHRELDDKQQLTRGIEAKWNDILNTTAKKTLLLGQIKMATHNLFTLVNRHLTMRHTTTTTAKQLEKIDEFIQDLSEMSLMAD